MDQTMLYDQGISLRRSGYPTIFGKKLTPGPLGPKKGPYGRSVGRFLATGLDFGLKIRFLL